MYAIVLAMSLWLASPDTYERLRMQGRDELRQAKYAKAAETLSAAIQEGESANVDARSLAIAINDLAQVRRHLGDYTQAESLYRGAVKLLRDKPDAAGELLRILGNQVILYQDMGQTVKSAAAFDEAQRLAKLPAVRNDALSTSAFDAIAASRSAANGDFRHARRLLERSLELREKTLGRDHLDVGESLNNLGVLYFQAGKYSKAEATLKRALAVAEKNLGPHHPDVAVTLNNLGVLYNKQKQFGAAEGILRRALEIRRETLPAHAPEIAESLYNLALVMVEAGRPGEAEELMRDAVTIRNQRPEDVNPELLATVEQYARVLRLNGRHADADRVDASAKALRAELKFVRR